MATPDKANAAGLPVAFILGDSISGAYTPPVKEKLAGIARVERPDDNCRNTVYLLQNLGEWLSRVEPKPSVVHFNAGLHDISLDKGEHGPHRVPLDDYRRNLALIVDALRDATGAHLIWATTTPVMDQRHAATKGFLRRQADVETFNACALDVMKEKGVTDINDLHAVIEKAGREACLREDGVHMVEEATALLAEAVAGRIRCALSVR